MVNSFFILNIFCFIINVVYYFYKKRGFSLLKLRYLIFTLFIAVVYFLLIDFPLFLIKDSDYILDNFNNYIGDIFNFNMSVIFLCCSIILCILNFLKVDKLIMDLEEPSYQTSKGGSIKLGKVLRGNSKKYDFSLSIKDLEKHMFVCGSTGTGKSNFLQNFLINFTKQYKKPFFLVEFKGEYHFLQDKLKDLLILWPGENFSINIFDPLGANPIIHAERIFDILKSGQFLNESAEYSPQMEKVLIEILTKICENKALQSWEGFEIYSKKYLNVNQNKIPMLKQTLVSLQNRIRRFSIGPIKAVFESNSKIQISELFIKNVILDLSSIIRLGGEKEDALFFLNMVLKYMWDKNLTQGALNYQGIKHITIIEDAQYFAPQDLLKKSKLTSYLEDIALIQRGTGECLITLSTRPNISREILANNGVVLTFKNHLEKDVMCELLNLDIEKRNYLSILDEGQCIIRVDSIKEPFLLDVPYIKRHFITVSEINRKNQLILEKSEKKLDSKIEFQQKTSKIYKLLLKNVKTSISKHFSKINLLKNKKILKKILQNREKEDSSLLSSTNLITVKNSKKNAVIMVEKKKYDKFDDYITNLFNEQEKNK